MKINTFFLTLIVSMVLIAGCSTKSGDDGVEVTSTKTVQDDTATAKTTNNDEEMSSESNTDDSTTESMEDVEMSIANIYFDFDQYKIRDNMQVSIENNSKIFSNSLNQSSRIKVEGNCDEWGTDEYNYALGLKRATNVKKALVSQGIKADRVTLVSYGEANPACSEKSKSCWEKNRRVELKILP